MPKMSFPSCSKLLERRWRERHYKAHQEKMNSMKSSIDSASPPKFPHLMLRLKKLQLEEEKQALIDYGNTVLLEKMSSILKRRGKVDNWNGYESRSLNSSHRLKELEQIAEQNAVIAKNLQKVRPKYSVTAWEEDYKKKAYYKGMWSESTKDWGIAYNAAMASTQRSRTFPESQRFGKSRLSTNSEEPSPSEPSSATSTDIDASDKVVGLPKISKTTKPKSEKEILVDQDAKLLFQGVKNLVPSNDSLNRTLIKRSKSHRKQVKDKFRLLYDLDLEEELRTALGNEYDCLIGALFVNGKTEDAITLKTAIVQKDIIGIVEFVCTRSQASMSNIRDTYRKKYTNSIEDDLKLQFEGEESLFLLTALAKEHHSDSSEVDEAVVQKEAHTLYESGDGRWTSDSGVFLKVLGEHNLDHMKGFLESFKQYNGGIGAGTVVFNECSPEFANGVKRMEKCLSTPLLFHAEKLHNTMDPKNPTKFIQLLLSRFEVDLQDVRKSYKKKYSRDLPTDIKSKFKGELGNTLSILASGTPIDKKNPVMKKPKVSAVHTTSPKKKTSKKAETKTKKSEHTDTKGVVPSKGKVVATGKRGNTSGKSGVSDKNGAKNGKYDSWGHSTNDANGGQSRQMDKQGADSSKKTTVSKPRVKAMGTVKPASEMNVDKDLQDIEQALKEWHIDGQALIDILSGRNNEQRQQIKRKYMEKYKKDLKTVLESELGGDFEEVIIALMMTPSRYDAYCLHEAIVSLGTRDTTLIAILATRSANELKLVNQQYLKAYGKNLAEDLKGDSSGFLTELLLELTKGGRDQSDYVHLAEAKEEAKKLYNDGSSLTVANNKLLQEILTKRNCWQVNAIFEEYQRLSGHTIIQGIRNSGLVDLEDPLITLVKSLKDPISFYTERIHNALDTVETDDKPLIRLIVSQSEVDLYNIKQKYLETYGSSLEERLDKECTASYSKLLLAIVKDK